MLKSFHAYLETQLNAGPKSAFDAPYSQLTLRTDTAMNGVGWGVKIDFVPRRGKR